MQFALQTVQPGILASSVPEQASTLPEFLLCFLAFHNALLRCKLGETAEKVESSLLPFMLCSRYYVAMFMP